MNPYLKNLEKIEFVITNACTGKCKHCSQGDHSLSKERIDASLAVEAVRKTVKKYPIKTVMTFGGEPLLFPDVVCAIMKCATELKIPKRQVITNGFFTRETSFMRKVCTDLFESGANDVLLSVDAFHQETIPLEIVMNFAKEAKEKHLPLRLQPAWLKSRSSENPYNRKTREILDCFSELSIPISKGNVVFPEGNAKRFLAEYFVEETPSNPYEEDPFDLHCLSFSSDGNVLNGNIYHQDLPEILKNYSP